MIYFLLGVAILVMTKSLLVTAGALGIFYITFEYLLGPRDS